MRGPPGWARDEAAAPPTAAVIGFIFDLPDEEERKISVIWVAEVVDGTVVSWRIVEAPAT